MKILAEEGESVFKTLIFDGAIETNGIGSGAFADFTALETVTFNGLLAENAVASGSFTGSGKLGGTANDPIQYIGTKDAPFVSYTVTGIENWAVNPFAKDAFYNEETQRVIWWSIADETLAKRLAMLSTRHTALKTTWNMISTGSTARSSTCTSGLTFSM